MLERFASHSFILFGVTLLVYSALSIFFSSPVGMTVTNGDEPHYLIAAHSLYYDHDFKTSNNYHNQDYRAFYDAEKLDQHLFNFKGRLVPYHGMLGMPLLIMLPYGLAGRIGVLVWLSILMAAALTLLYRVVRVYVPANIAFATVLFCGLTYPVVIYSHQIYPDMVAFVITTFVLTQIIAPTQRNERMTALLVGTALGMLPHFHFKFAVLAAMLYLFFLWAQFQKPSFLRIRAANFSLPPTGEGEAMHPSKNSFFFTAFAWSLGPILLLGLAFVAWIIHVYGEFSLAVFISPSQGAFANGRFDGIPGLWFDQEFGLFFFAPFYIMALFGAWSFWRNPATRAQAFFLTLIYVAQHLLSGSFYDWEGGLSPAPRYLVAVLPILIVFAAKGVADAWARRQWSQPAGLAFGTLWITRLILFVRRNWMFGYHKGSNTILRDHYHLDWLLPLLPSFKNPNWAGAYLRLGVLIVGFVALWLIGAWVNRRLFASQTAVK